MTTAGLSNLRAQEATSKGVADIARHIPAAPSPAVVAQNGESAITGINFLGELNLLFQDALALREWSVRREGDTERVVNPRMFDRAISRRLEILAMSIATQKALWDLQRMEAFYSTIIETIAGCAPEVGQEIQRRLVVLNVRLGMTCNIDDGQ